MSFIIGLFLGAFTVIVSRKLVNRSLRKKFGNIYTGLFIEADSRCKCHKKLTVADIDLLEYTKGLASVSVPYFTNVGDED